MTHPFDTLTACAGAALFAALIIAPAQAGDTVQRTHVEHMATDTAPSRPIGGATARLITSGDGVTMWLETADLEPGHVTTAWWVFMARPEKCSATPCAAEDVISGAERVGTQIVYADGVVNNPDGTARFAAHLPRGPVSRGWYEQNLEHPDKVEIHLVLKDHGPLIPEIAASMLTSYRGGCRDDSLPPPFPASAKADGIPGPNACKLIQDAIFVQSEPPTE